MPQSSSATTPVSLASPLSVFLADHRTMVMDGALATELERRGADLNDALWSAKLLMEQPALIRAVHADYFLAGADVATTASYQATFEGFAKRGISRADAADLMRLATALACEARDAFWAEPANRAGRSRPLVAASVGPYGAMLADGSEYRGHYGLSRAALADFHRERLQVLAASGADLLACETIPCLVEALAIADVLAELGSITAWVSFSCKDGEHNAQGERLADCAAALEQFPHIVAIGVNCTAPQYVASLVAQAAAHTTKPVLAYPNSGEHYDAGAKVWSGACQPSESFAEQAMRWQHAGARLIGGCCRTGPADIRAVRSLAAV